MRTAAAIGLLAVPLVFLIATTSAEAVTFDIDLVSDGDPAPNVTITLETTDGKPVKETQAPETDEHGNVTVEFDESSKQHDIVIVIHKNEHVVRRDTVQLTGVRSQVKLEVPANDLAVLKSQPLSCRSNTFCRFRIKTTNHGVYEYVGPLFILDTMPAPVRLGSIGGRAWRCLPEGSGETLCLTKQVRIGSG